MMNDKENFDCITSSPGKRQMTGYDEIRWGYREYKNYCYEAKLFYRLINNIVEPVYLSVMDYEKYHLFHFQVRR